MNETSALPKTGSEHAVLRHAKAFVRFHPRSLTFFHGIQEEVAAAACRHWLKKGWLTQDTLDHEIWFRWTSPKELTAPEISPSQWPLSFSVPSP